MLVKPLATSLSVALFPGVIDCDVVEPLPPLNGGGSDLNSSSSGYARLGSGVAPPLGVVKEEVAVLIALVRRHRRAVGAAARRAVGDEVPGAVERRRALFLMLSVFDFCTEVEVAFGQGLAD